MLRAKIVGTGSHLPERILTNHDLSEMVDTTDEWIRERTGIVERRIASPEQAASDIAYEAGKKALKRAGMKAKELDLIIVATLSGDSCLPATACLVQHRLGAKNAGAFDLNAACSGFLYSLSTASAFISSGMMKHILVIGAEILSKFTDWEDRTTCVLFGDAAGAVVLSASEGQSGIVSSHLYADGAYSDLLKVVAGGSRVPSSLESVANREHYIRMKGNETFKVAVKALERVVNHTLKVNKLKPSDIALLIPHQANLRIIQATASRLGVSMDKVFINLDRYGNTSAASIAVALDEAARTGRIREDDYILMEAFGGGLTWASVLVKW